MELTLRVIKDFDLRFRLVGTLRGTQLELKRIGDRPNGKLHAILTSQNLPNNALPEAPDVEKFLTRMWGYPADQSVPKLFQQPPGSEPKDGRAQA